MDLYNLSAYDYNLPKDLIAQKAHEPQDECKLLYYKNNEIKDLIFKDIKNLLNENDILFFNNSKVIKARIKGKLEKDIFNLDEDGKDEIFFLKKLEGNTFSALIKPGRKFKVGKKIKIKDYPYIFEILNYTKEGRLIYLHSDKNIFDVLEEIGSMPLPPYVNYKKDKESSYQAITAKKPGSVAAPTASLHFTKDLLKNLQNKGVGMLYSTLHIGMGTFKTVDTKDIREYDIHEELIEVPLDIFDKLSEQKNKNIVAVGTTATRILESLPFVYAKLNLKNNSFWNELIKNIKNEHVQRFIPGDIIKTQDSFVFETKLFIYPGFKFHLVDKLITNFHLPKSSLLMLVAAFMGYENMKKSYDHAIKNNYRFFSFGDAMFIDSINGKNKKNV